jgi:predicted amidohydrolase
LTRLLLAELAPRPGAPAENLARIREVVAAKAADLVVFPELFLTGYRVGDRLHTLALREGDPQWGELSALAHDTSTTIVVGAAVASTARRGELHNVALEFRPDGGVGQQVKRYLPTFGPFEEGVPFTPSDESHPVPFGSHRLGLQVCYDTFFPEVSRALALEGADLLVVVSASPVTSGVLFERLLPARAIENGLPVVYTNRVGVEDGVVFGGRSGAWDSRGERRPTTRVEFTSTDPSEQLLFLELDLTEPARWRPFRPVLRDVASRPGDRQPSARTTTL